MENIWEKYKLVNLIDFFGAEIWDLVLTIQSDSETGDIKAGKRDFQENGKKKFQKKDFILIIVILFLALVAFFVMSIFSSNKGEVVVVTVDNVEYARLPLHTDTELLIENVAGETNLLVIRNGEASIQKATCKNQDCVHSAVIVEEGGLIVCLPNKVVVSIENGE